MGFTLRSPIAVPVSIPVSSITCSSVSTEDSAARQAAFGTGMGLSITRGLLAAAGGRVWAENVPGAGARFTIVVPGATRPATVTRLRWPPGFSS